MTFELAGYETEEEWRAALNAFSVDRFVVEAGRPSWDEGQLWFAEHVTGKTREDIYSASANLAMRYRNKHITPRWDRLPFVCAREYNLLQINNGVFINVLCVDIDGEGERGVAEAFAQAAACPIPPTLTVASNNGAHAMWAIEPVHWKQDRAHQFARDCRHNLTRAAGGDHGYSNHSARNPLYLRATVEWGELRPYRLGEIREALSGDWEYPSFGMAADHGDGRNSELYTLLRDMARKGADLSELRAAAARWNDRPDPLPQAEVDGLVRRAHRGVLGGSRGYSGRARRGGQSTSPAKQEAARRNLQSAQQARQEQAERRYRLSTQLTQAGWSAQRIADHQGISVRTVRDHRRFARAEDAYPEE